MTAQAFDPKQAVQYGLFAEATYNMYDGAPSNPTPPPPSPFIAGYRFIAWVQMRDFVFEGGSWMFYGLLAQHTSNPNEFVLAIRGTSNLTEWFDDITSMALVPLSGWGQVSYGFNRIYQTLRIVDEAASAALTATPAPTQPTGTFAQQVAAAVQKHAALAKPQDRTALEAAAAPMSIEVTGHSLGAALATLYVAENAAGGHVTTPLLCTFASPRVGDSVFAARFDQLGIASWRIVNELDIVPKLPAIGFTHVATEYSYTSGSSVDWSLACWHELATYLNLLDPTQPIAPECRRAPQPAVAAMSLRAAAEVAAPAPAAAAPAAKEISLPAPSEQGGTINITIKIGGTN
jgi:Lipase (class 3)